MISILSACQLIFLIRVRQKMNSMSVIEKLAETYPQLYLNPDSTGKEAYRKVVLEGAVPEVKDLSHFEQDVMDREETVETPAGKVQVISLRNRKDYETFVRCMMAAKEGPEKPIPASQGASTLVVFNWPRINEHKREYLEAQLAAGVSEPDWSAEFQRFISVRENYQDLLVVLSWGPYSNITAEQAGQPEESWPETSYTIRKYHELTHVICRRLYPDRIEAVWDELVADAIGIYAAFGKYDAELEKLFLGISEGQYTGGRLENYTDDAQRLAIEAGKMLDQFSEIIGDRQTEPFDLIPVLQEYQSAFRQA